MYINRGLKVVTGAVKRFHVGVVAPNGLASEGVLVVYYCR